MRTTMVQVPDALLADRQLVKSAKLLWIVLQHIRGGDVTHIPRTGVLQARSGLARHTVLRALAQLRTRGWLPAAPDRAAPGQGASGQGAHIPADLLSDHRIGVQAKLLYAWLQRIAGRYGLAGQFTYAGLCARAGISPHTAKRAIRTLQAAGWLEFTQQSKFSPICFTLCNPVARKRDEAVARVERRLRAAGHKGEAIMRAFLSVIVESDEHDDDASPAFLVNPFTGEELQFDRYYPPGVAVEFNGPQHDGPTERFPDETEALKQQARDYIKQRICAARGIHLVVVHPEDLSLERLRHMVAGHLPLRDLEGHEAVIAYLERSARGYREKAAGGRVRSA